MFLLTELSILVLNNKDITHHQIKFTARKPAFFNFIKAPGMSDPEYHIFLVDPYNNFTLCKLPGLPACGYNNGVLPLSACLVLVNKT